MLSDALIVFCLRQYLVVASVCKYKDRALYAAEILLDDYPCGSVSEHTGEHFLQFLSGFIKCRQDENALSGAQSVSLQHIRGFQRFQKSESFLKCLTRERAVFCGRYAVPLHKTLGKILRSLKHGTCL